VPDFVGQDVAAVTASADELGWQVDDSTEDRRDGTVPGQVLAQDPPPGETLAEGEVLRLTVSLGPTLVAAPQLPGVPLDQATAAIEQAGFVVGSVSRAVDEEVPVDAVISATPADPALQVDSQGRLPKGTSIDLVVSSGPAPRVVPPGLQGAGAGDAVAALEAVQLVPRRNESFSEVVPEGFVISVSQAPGTEVARGSDVVLEVSKGPAPITVPDVRFNSGSVATALLEDAGFTVSGIEGSPSGMVLATDPPAGEQHPRGTAVRIFTRS
jgi:serine/threonine-protein kinase